MRVLFDGHWWVDGPVSNRQVVREFVSCWASQFPDDELVMAAPGRHLDQVRREAPASVRLVGTRLPLHAATAIIEMPWWCRRVHADVMLNQNFTAAAGPCVTFIHDVMFQTSPEWFTLPERAYFALMPVTARRASLVVTSSHHEASRIRQQNPRVARVVPVGLAGGTELLATPAQRPADLPDVSEYVLSVGRLNVRKNLAFTFEVALQSGQISTERPLVVVGEPDGPQQAHSRRIDDAIREGEILFMGHLPAAELVWLYQNARLMVFLSLDEGFGLPPLEARALGCPVLASDIPVFRETLGADATLVDPTSVAAAAKALAGLLTAPRVAPIADDLPSWPECTRRLREAVVEAITLTEVRKPATRPNRPG